MDRFLQDAFAQVPLCTHRKPKPHDESTLETDIQEELLEVRTSGALVDASCSDRASCSEGPAEILEKLSDDLERKAHEMQELAARLRSLESAVPVLTGQVNFFRSSYERSSARSPTRQLRRDPTLGSRFSQILLPGTLSKVRSAVVAVQSTGDEVQQVLQLLTPRRGATYRAYNLVTLEELIGPKPNHRWSDEWVEMVCEFHRTTNRPIKGSPEPSTMSNYELADWVATHFSLDRWREDFSESIAATVKYGWEPERAEIFNAVSYTKSSLARALRDGESSYAAATYAICDVFFEQQEAQANTLQLASPPRLYTHLDGRSSLVMNEPSWAFLLEPDKTGFRGHTCTAMVTADCDPVRMDKYGHKAFNPDPAVMKLEAVASDIVCFEPKPDDEFGAHVCAHAPVMFDELYGVFPPNTLFRLSEILEPGTWEGPGGVWPMQRLLVVTATYRPATIGARREEMASKMMGSTVSLSYGKREAFVSSLSGLLATPTLTMEMEFARDIEWVDWKGEMYSLREEWAYVKGPAMPKPHCTPGTRDAGNAGKTPEKFMAEVNEFIRQRRKKGWGVALLEQDAFLSLDEVLAVRLYSGPAFQPINTFLREVSKLSVEYKMRIARDPSLTYCATVQAIIDAIRKLAAVVTEEEASKPLWRGVRGELPKGFWIEDDLGFVCAVEMGFVSTSRCFATPFEYMDPTGPNVLWALQSAPETDEGYHCGADISMLSQFASEQEFLFPPCTMLVVKAQSSRGTGDLCEAGGEYGEVFRAQLNRQKEIGAVWQRKPGSMSGRASLRKDEDSRASTMGYQRRFEVLGRRFTHVEVLPSFI